MCQSLHKYAFYHVSHLAFPICLPGSRYTGTLIIKIVPSQNCNVMFCILFVCLFVLFLQVKESEKFRPKE